MPPHVSQQVGASLVRCVKLAQLGHGLAATLLFMLRKVAGIFVPSTANGRGKSFVGVIDPSTVGKVVMLALWS